MGNGNPHKDYQFIFLVSIPNLVEENHGSTPQFINHDTNFNFEYRGNNYTSLTIMGYESCVPSDSSSELLAYFKTNKDISLE